uniref:Fibronectin type-III domain-containing protein n=1 Tax=Meloidogyne floridensis TaxID=298350 RepID=A0A915P8M6_9BILA
MPKIINNNYFIFPSFLPFILFLTTISSLLLFPLLPVDGFEAIPFLQIDYNFYIRLAQCEAKCLEKFSSLNKRIIIAPTDSQSITDKQFNHQMAIGSSLMLENICKQGCLDSDSPPPPPPQSPSQSTFQHQQQLDTQPTNAFVLGQQFFKQSSNKNPPPPSFSSFGGIIRPLCVQKMSSSSIPSSQNTFSLHQEKFETFLIYEDLNEKIKKENLRFVVCWRSKKLLIKDEELKEEEPQWITASIESSHRFKVSSLRPGLLYQFKVQAVSPSGIQVPAAFSDWIDFNSLIYGSGINTKSLQFYSQFNSDYGVAAWVSWRLNEVKKLENGENAGIQTTKPILNARLRRHLIRQNEDFNNTNNLVNIQNRTIKSQEELFTEKQKSSFVVFPSCKLQIEWANKSSRASDKFELDGSDGYLLTNLAFNSEYWVNIRAEYNNSNNIEEEEEEQLTTTLFEGNFLSMKCLQVYGFGSLECKPEPIQKLSIFPFPTNNTALVKWERPLAITNVLLYELNIEPIIRSGDDLNIKEKCKTENGLNTKIVSAQANFTWISLPHEAVCEFEVRHTLYDLLGREATAHLRFIFTPSSTSEPSSTDTQYSLAFRQFISQLDISVLALVCVIVLVPITALIALICTISRRDTRQKTKKRTNKKPLSAEKHNKIIKKTKMQKNNIQRPTIVNDSKQNYYSNTNINSVIITSLEDKYLNNSNQQISYSNKLNTSPQSSSCVSAGAETTITLLPLKGENGEINNNCGDIKLNNSFGNTAWTGQNRRVKIEMPLILN